MIGMSNHNKRNPLHLAALHGSIEAMDVLAAGNLTGLDATARDRDGHTPSECFLKCRNAHCAVARMPFDVERASFTRLMKSVTGDLDLSSAAVHEDDNSNSLAENDHDHGSETGSDIASDEEYMNAEDSFEAE